MADTLASLCFGLPQSASKQLSDFVFNPAAYLHPDRGAMLVPVQLQGSGFSGALLSKSLLNGLGLNEEVPLNLSDKLHRVALLPTDALAKLVLRLALYQYAQRLKQVVLRSELEQLQKHVSPLDWDFIFSVQAPKLDADDGLLDRVPVADWPLRLSKWGWRTLESACSVLPESLGKRWLLKLPVVSSAQHAEPEVACTMLRAIYPAWVQQWNPEWDAGWQMLTSSST